MPVEGDREGDAARPRNGLREAIPVERLSEHPGAASTPASSAGGGSTAREPTRRSLLASCSTRCRRFWTPIPLAVSGVGSTTTI
jgi:hypothetical protein